MSRWFSTRLCSIWTHKSSNWLCLPNKDKSNLGLWINQFSIDSLLIDLNTRYLHFLFVFESKNDWKQVAESAAWLKIDQNLKLESKNGWLTKRQLLDEWTWTLTGSRVMAGVVLGAPLPKCSSWNCMNWQRNWESTLFDGCSLSKYCSKSKIIIRWMRVNHWTCGLTFLWFLTSHLRMLSNCCTVVDKLNRFEDILLADCDWLANWESWPDDNDVGIMGAAVCIDEPIIFYI